MNRFHVHIHVADLEANVRFYSQLFGAEPTVRKSDYAKWMIEDPRVNFAISSDKTNHIGIAHLGLQAGCSDGLAAIGNRLKAADAVALAEAGTMCCYARSDKFWAVDPQGVEWEAFHTHGEATTYYAPDTVKTGDSCCGPGTGAGTASTSTTAAPAGSCATAPEPAKVASSCGSSACG